MVHYLDDIAQIISVNSDLQSVASLGPIDTEYLC